MGSWASGNDEGKDGKTEPEVREGKTKRACPVSEVPRSTEGDAKVVADNEPVFKMVSFCKVC